ncbi:MAG: hypothetical protein ACK5XT_02495 [Gemmatimonas sp.]|jgi:hypothetical protein|uniref:hypothetical protein n=1 Tax=Gemmatimonas sp. TaxID=1962908 RepID=UPI00391F7F80
MNPYVRDRINRKLETLSDERLYQVLDYVEFLEARYAEKPAPVINVFQRFTDGVEDTLRAGGLAVGTVSEAMGFLSKAMGVLNDVAQTTRTVATDVVSTARTVADQIGAPPPAGAGATAGPPAATPSAPVPPSSPSTAPSTPPTPAAAGSVTP